MSVYKEKEEGGIILREMKPALVDFNDLTSD